MGVRKIWCIQHTSSCCWMLLLVSCCSVRRALEQERYAVNSYIWLNKYFFFKKKNSEWLLVPNRLQNRLFFQYPFVLFQCLFNRGWAELHCTFTILLRLLTTRVLQHKDIDVTAAGAKIIKGTQASLSCLSFKHYFQSVLDQRLNLF